MPPSPSPPTPPPILAGPMPRRSSTLSLSRCPSQRIPSPLLPVKKPNRWNHILQCSASRQGVVSWGGVLLEVAGEEGCTNRYAPPLRLCRYFDAAVLVSTWPAISLRSFGYSTISI